MPTETIIIREIPKGQRRARFFRRGSFTGTFDPDRESKLWVKHLCRDQIEEMITDPINLEMKVFMPIPKSTSKKKRALMLTNELKHTKSPDVDNIFKRYTNLFNCN